MKLGKGEITRVVDETPGGEYKNVTIGGKGNITVHRQVFDDNVHGMSVSFANIGFETEADRKRKEKGLYC